MNATLLTTQMRQARFRLMRLEQELGRVTRDLAGATHNRIVGGVAMLIGSLALVGFFLSGYQLLVIIAASGLLIGGLVFFRALAKMGGARSSLSTVTDGVADARAQVSEFEAQPPAAE